MSVPATAVIALRMVSKYNHFQTPAVLIEAFCFILRQLEEYADSDTGQRRCLRRPFNFVIH